MTDWKTGLRNQMAAWEPTRDAAEAQLADFLGKVSNYGRDRNHVYPDHPRVSRMSPWIRCRLISEYELVERVLRKHSFNVVEKFIQEVYWRIYWKGWLEMRPAVWSAYRGSIVERKRQLSGEDSAALEALEAGQGPCPLMNRFSRELTETGYLHNHARMWFAGYWIHSLGLPWELGADFFYRHLLDADPASNTLSWRWVAGCQTRGKEYHARAGNIRKYCHYPEAGDPDLDKHLEGGGRVESAAEGDAQNPDPEWEPASMPQITQPYLLWLHGEDLSVWRDTLSFPVRKPEGVIGVFDSRLADRFGISTARKNFIRGALKNALDGMQRDCGVESCLRNGELGEELVRYLRESNCRILAGVLPPVGPLRDALPRLRKQLQDKGMELHLWRRSADEKWMPLATGGFFRFWKAVQKTKPF